MEEQYKSLILDVGCGDNKQGDIGVDIRKLKGVDIVCDVTFLPLRDNIFDEVKSSVVIEHIFDVVLFFKEQFRVLKNDGIVFCEADNARYWRYHLDANIFFSQDFVSHFKSIQYDASEEHLRIYYPECLKRIFYKSDILPIRIKYLKSQKKLDRIIRFFLPFFWKNTCIRFYIVGLKKCQ